MAYSMTGFGRGETLCDTRRYTCEIKSVNSRFCDINIRMPRLFNFADAKIRKLITDELTRGKVDVFINFDDSQNEASEVVLNEGLVKAYASAVGNIASITGADGELSAVRLSTFPDVLTVRQKEMDEDQLYSELSSCLKAAIDGMKDMRSTEGSNLVKDILDKVASLEKIRDEIATRAPEVVKDYRTEQGFLPASTRSWRKIRGLSTTRADLLRK